MRRTLPAALLALALLAGCGGGDAGEGSTAGGEAARSGTGTEEAASTPSAERKHAAERLSAPPHHGSSGSDGDGAEPGGPAPTPKASLPNEGTKKVAPGVPTAKGGDNSIQEFGVESESAERVAASRALKVYLVARAAGDWSRACAGISAGLEAEIGHLGGPATQEERSRCAKALRTLTEGVPADALRISAAIHVLSMRVEGSTAYVIYKNGEGAPTAIPMAREGDEWKVGALDGSALVLSGDDFY